MLWTGNTPWGHSWRSAKWFIVTCITIALFSENFIYSYIVPILPVIIEDRLHIGKSNAQYTTSLVLSVHAFVGILTGIPTGHLADKIDSRKMSLLASLGAEVTGTIVIMFSKNVPCIVVGRSIQAIGGNAAWIVGLATIADTVGQENTGKTMGAVSSFFVSGLLFGPMLSGTLLESVGYWPTWMVAIAVLLIDMLMRVVMIENRSNNEGSQDSGNETSKDIESREAEGEHDDRDINEQSALLAPPPSNGINKKNDEQTSVYENFYKVILSNPRALCGLLGHFTTAMVLVSFDTTLPLYVEHQFGWGSSQVSLMFLILQMPSLVLSSVVGMVKDRIGTRVPTAIGFVIAGIFMFLIGTPNIGDEHTSRIVYMIAIGGVGLGRTLTAGCGIIEMTNLMKELEQERPGRFGPNGKLSSGYSMTNFCWTLGMLLGPIVTGFMTRIFGYSYMNYSVGTLCLAAGTLASIFLGRR